MRKRLLFIILIILVLGTLFACFGMNSSTKGGNTSSASSEKLIAKVNNEPLESQIKEATDPAKYIDKTVDFPKNDISGLTSKNCKEIGMIDPDYAFGAITYEDLFEHSDSIIIGEIKDGYYTTRGRFVYTVADVLVNENIKGDSEKLHTITVLSIGGYISAKDYQKLFEDEGFSPTIEKNYSYYYFHLNNAPEIAIGENYLFCLRADTDGSYYILNDRSGIFKETEDGFKRNAPEDYYGNFEIEGETRLENNVSFTKEEFKEKYISFSQTKQ